jgi:hypothetical protein
MPELYRDGRAQPDEYRVKRTGDRHAALLAGHSADWERAATIAWGPAAYETQFRALWTDQGLHLRFDAVDDRPWRTMTGRDDPLWDEEVVEIFLDPARTGHHYAELEISPANVVCDLRIVSAAPRQADIGWNFDRLESQVSPWPEGGRDGWSAFAWLSFDDLSSLSPEAAAAVPPAAGARWRFNVCRIKRPGGPTAPEAGALYAAWAVPDGGTFHAPEVFRDLVFNGP